MHCTIINGCKCKIRGECGGVLDDHAIRAEMGPFEFGPSGQGLTAVPSSVRVMGRGEERTFHNERSAYPSGAPTILSFRRLSKRGVEKLNKSKGERQSLTKALDLLQFLWGYGGTNLFLDSLRERGRFSAM